MFKIAESEKELPIGARIRREDDQLQSSPPTERKTVEKIIGYIVGEKAE